MAADDWKRDLSEIVFARLPIIGWTTAAITVGAIAIALWYPPTYQARGSLILRSKTVQNSTDSLNAPDVGAVPLSMHDLVSERQLLTSGTLIQRVIVRLQEGGKIERPAAALNNAKSNPISSAKSWLVTRLKRLASLGKRADADLDRKADPEMTKAVAGIRDAISAEIVPDSTIINLTLRGGSISRVETFLDTLISEHLKYRLEVLHPEDQRQFYRDRRDFYSQRLQALESELVGATEAASVTELESEIENNIDLTGTLNLQKSDLRNLYMEQQQRTSMLDRSLKQDDVSYFTFLDNLVLEGLSAQLMELRIERGRVVRQFRDGSPQIMALDENIAATSSELKTEVQAIYRDAVEKQNTMLAQIRLLGLRVDELKERTAVLQHEAVKFRQLSREADLLRISYESFARRNEEAEISEAVSASDVSGDVTVLNRPAFTAVKIFPKLLLTPLLGLMIGLITGCSIAFVVEFFDHTIRRASDVSNFLSMPVIGSLRRVDAFQLRNRKKIKKQSAVASGSGGKRYAS
jgi:uncharacterized protein involved in exopolysaccharide biosynthesis